MAAFEYNLCKPPEDDKGRKLWLEHAAGLIVFEDARNYAIEQIPENTDSETRQKIIKGIDNAIYGMMMMIFDGVSGYLKNSEYEVKLSGVVSLINKGDDEDKVVDSLDLIQGDGVCMDYHGWLEGDYGEDPVAVKK